MNVAEILAGFGKLSALVVGDICLDRWCVYDPAVEEPSRETGLPRVGVVRTEVTPGAGGTVAGNLAALGAGRVEVLGVFGDDGFGVELSRALAARGIGSGLSVRAAGRQTFTYTKVINAATGAEDQPRLDFINIAPLEPSVERRILDTLATAADAFDVIVIADQAETDPGGVVTPAVRDLLAELALVYPYKVWLADSRMRVERFRNVMIKPNREEAASACRKVFGRVDYPALREHACAPLMLVTHGAEGVMVVEPGGVTGVPARAVEHPVDICGAGDSFAAGAALALKVTGSPVDAARFGNLVAGVTIGKPGTGTASPAELLEAAR